MKRLFSLLIILTLCLTACGEGTVSCPADNDAPPAQSETGSSSTVCWSEPPASSWSVTEDITVSLSQDTFAPETEQFTVTFTNTGSQVMLYGGSYSFQYHDGSDWKNPETIENYGFTMEGYLLFPGATQTLSVGPWMLTEPLPEGRCRIVGCDLRVADSEDQLTYGGDYTEYPPYQLEFDIAQGAPAPMDAVISDTAFCLDITQPEPGAERLEFAIVNESGADAQILHIPTLEYINEFGNWETVPFLEDVGFCGTPDPLPPGRKDWSLEPGILWDTLPAGTYRLSYTVTDGSGNEFTASGEFTCDADLCGYPLLEQ